MEKIILGANVRHELGKEANKKLRAQGNIPAVVYKKGKESTPLKVDKKELFRILHTSASENVIITLQIKDEEKDSKPIKDKTVIIKEIQHEPIKGDMVHIDFNEISLTEKITVNVPIETKGEPIGVKSDGGVLEHVVKELQIECLPTEIPQRIEVHVEVLKIGDSLRVKNLTIPSGIRVLNDPELTVLSVVPPHIEKPAEEVAAEEVVEPEVIREKKPEAEEAGEEAGKPEEGKK